MRIVIYYIYPAKFHTYVDRLKISQKFFSCEKRVTNVKFSSILEQIEREFDFLHLRDRVDRKIIKMCDQIVLLAFSYIFLMTAVSQVTLVSAVNTYELVG